MFDLMREQPAGAIGVEWREGRTGLSDAMGLGGGGVGSVDIGVGFWCKLRLVLARVAYEEGPAHKAETSLRMPKLS